MSGYIGTQPVPQATQHRGEFTATASQTSFATTGYTPTFMDVYLNGIKLAAAEYTATNGSDIVLTTGAALDDILEYVAYTSFDVANQTFTGTTTFEVMDVTGPITSTSTFDGRDVSVDGAKLDGIEAGADITDSANVDPLVDTHLNTGAAGAGEILSWTGSDYDWVADSGATVLTALTDTPVGYGTAGQILATNATLDGTEWVNSDKISVGTTITTDTSITNADLVGNVFYDVSAAAIITIPPGLTGTEPVTFQQTGVGDVTFAAGVGVTIQAFGGNLSIADQFGSVSLVPKGGDVYGLIGALA